VKKTHLEFYALRETLRRCRKQGIVVSLSKQHITSSCVLDRHCSSFLPILMSTLTEIVFNLLFSYILQRAFSVLDGIGKTLNKKFDIGEIAAPYARNLLIEANPDALPPQVVTAQREWLKRADAQTRAVVNLFKAPDAIESIADIIRRIETGKLKIRVRALEVERAVERVAVTQDITLKALIASCMANIGCVLWVTNPGLYLIQAKIALGLATVMMLQAVKGQLTLSKMLKKEAKYSGAD